MKNYIVLVLATIVFSTACSDKKKDYEGSKESVAQHEAKKGLLFLKLSELHNKKNLIGEWVLKGKVESSASIAQYKDIEVQIDFYSKTKSLLGTEYYTLFETLKPNSGVDFKYKSFGFKGSDSVALKIKSFQSLNN